jgi:homoserine dehydrogenase
MNQKKLNIGLFGFGTVGSGLYDVLKRINSKNVEIKRVCVRNLAKPRSADVAFTDNADDIFNDVKAGFGQ